MIAAPRRYGVPGIGSTGAGRRSRTVVTAAGDIRLSLAEADRSAIGSGSTL